MIEYLHNAIIAVSGQDIGIAATISNDETGEPITSNCSLMLYNPDGSMLYEAKGNYIEDADIWQFTIPASITTGIDGRYWYCIQNAGNNLCFKNPIYLKG
jgi:hypothetical protein